MIGRLRNRFIRIATLSVAAVMLLLTVILNVANYISTDADLRDTLTLIAENQGTIPVGSFTPSPSDGGTPPDLDAPLPVDKEPIIPKDIHKQFIEEERAEWRQFKELLRSLRKK